MTLPVILSRARRYKNRWWAAGGATGAIVAYQPKGAVSYATSLRNLVNPGVNDAAAGVAPSWTRSGGWSFNGSNQYLVSTAVLQLTYTAIVRIASFTPDTSPRTVMGVFQGSDSRSFVIQSFNNDRIRSFNGGFIDNTPMLTSGTLAIAGKQPYRNGATESNVIAAGGTNPSLGFYIGGLNNSGSLAQVTQVTVIALAVYNNALNASQVAAVAAAMAAL